MNTFIITMCILYALGAIAQFLSLVLGLYPMEIKRTVAYGVCALTASIFMLVWTGLIIWSNMT
jgi:hypothetical protein